MRRCVIRLHRYMPQIPCRNTKTGPLQLNSSPTSQPAGCQRGPAWGFPGSQAGDGRLLAHRSAVEAMTKYRTGELASIQSANALRAEFLPTRGNG